MRIIEKIFTDYCMFDLQRFSDGDGDNGDNIDTAGTGNEEEQQEEKDIKYTDEDVNRIINKKFAEWQRKQDEAAKLAKMTAEEKAAHEAEEMKKEIAALKAEKAKESMTKQARSILHDKGLNLPDALVTVLIAEKAEDTKKNVDEFVKIFQKAVADEVKEKLKGTTPKVGSPASQLTKEDIMKIKNAKRRQQAIRENIDLFK